MTTDQVIFASKNQHKAQISSKLRQKFEQFEVLFTGFSGLQNSIFGKFFAYFPLAMFGNTSYANEFLDNAMI